LKLFKNNRNKKRKENKRSSFLVIVDEGFSLFIFAVYVGANEANKGGLICIVCNFVILGFLVIWSYLTNMEWPTYLFLGIYRSSACIW
jgi:hypothetical protein